MLHQERSFDPRFPMSIQESIKKFLIELARIDFWCVGFPPIWFIGAVVESNAAELARVGKDKCALSLKQDEMIVFRWPIIRRLDANLARHAEMNSEPIVAGELEEHPFPARMRTEKFRADQALPKGAHVLATKDSVPCVHAKIDNLRAAPDVPLFAKPFDLGQLRHRGN